MAKTLIFGYFGYESAKIAKMRFFFENRALSLFLFNYALIYSIFSEKSLDGKYDNSPEPEHDFWSGIPNFRQNGL